VCAQWKHVNWIRNTIFTYDKGKKHFLPITNFLRKTLAQRWKDLGSNIDPDDHVIKYTSWTITHCFKKAMQEAGIKKTGAVHILRRTLPVELLEEGANIAEVRAWLDHSDIKTTDIYVHIKNDRLQKLAKKRSKSI
jgi:site-specific recombinase XerD